MEDAKGGTMAQRKRVVIIGAGVAGLAAAYDLVKRGFDATIVEAAGESGGLAASISIDDQPVEKYYHL